MGRLILDMQCVLGSDGKYLIKELSAIDTESCAVQHWIFKYSTTMFQNAKSRSINNWLERHFHKMSLTYGDVECEEIGRILNSLQARNIYVKGEQKKQLLLEYLPGITIINMELMGCPRIDELYPNEEFACCLFHKELNPKLCTFYKVFTLRKWFLENV